jgi:hypothetical protein
VAVFVVFSPRRLGVVLVEVLQLHSVPKRIVSFFGTTVNVVSI